MTDDFGLQIRDALAHLYDYDYLARSALARALDPTGQLSARERMRQLRGTLLDGIEALNPGSDVSPYSLRQRSYAVLTTHYVDRLTVQRVAAELCLSERQVYRDLRQAEQDLAAILWGRFDAPSQERPIEGENPTRTELALTELDRLSGTDALIDLVDELKGALRAVARLAEQSDISVSVEPVVGETQVRVERQATRQVLVGLLSFALQSAQRGTRLSVWCKGVDDKVRFVIEFDADNERVEFPSVIAGMVRRLGGEWSASCEEPARVSLHICLSAQENVTVLVIDDNQGLIDLFHRYLAGTQYHILAARVGGDGLALARDARVDVIVLDVLMPGEDGWEVLQRIRADAALRDTPVIVCSVLDDPQLALSLGANSFLPKPVSRPELLAELSSHAASALGR